MLFRFSFISIIFFLISLAGFSQNEQFKVGAASKIINNELGSWAQGAGEPMRATERRDDSEANAIYLAKGDFHLLIISCDLNALESSIVVPTREAISTVTGLLPRDVLISCTHAHGGPSLAKTNYLVPIDTAYIERLKKWLVELAMETVNSAKPAKIGWAKGEAPIGYSRRPTWADGTHSMGGDTRRKDFTGLEGPDDHQHTALFAADKEGKLISVVYNNTTHPTNFYSSGIYSADFPGEVRKSIREVAGNKIPVLFLNGAQGDIAMNDLMNPVSENREQRLKRISKIVFDETMRLYKEITFDDDPVLKHEYHDLKVAVRLPSAEQLVEGRKILKRIDAGENIRGMEMIMAFGAVSLQEKYSDSPFDILPVHAVRIGDLAMVTQPCELYCQFGLDIKRRSPVSNTIVVSLTDGRGGYCPTIYGFLGGGYSGAPIAWTRLEPFAGYKIVETASGLLYELWKE